MGHPYTFLPIIWSGKVTIGQHFDSYEEFVEDDMGNSGMVMTDIYRFWVNGRPFEANCSSHDFGETAKIKYLPSDPSIAFLDGEGVHSANAKAILFSLLNLGIVGGILFGAYYCARDGFRSFR